MAQKENSGLEEIRKRSGPLTRAAMWMLSMLESPDQPVPIPHKPLIQNYEKPGDPRLRPHGILAPGMRGVTQDSISKRLIVSYTFERTSKIDAYETAEMQANGYIGYRPFNQEEKEDFLAMLPEFSEASGNIYVEAKDPEQANLTLAVFEDLSKVWNHSNNQMGIGGECGYPNADGTTLVIKATKDRAWRQFALRHEAMHWHGAPHTFEIEAPGVDMLPQQYDSYAASDQAYQRGSIAHAGGETDLPATLQTLDYKFLQENYAEIYAPCPKRAPRKFVADGHRFTGTIETQPDDTLRVTAARAGLVTAGEGIEYPARLDSMLLWTVGVPPRNIEIEKGNHVVMVPDSANLKVEKGNVTAMAGMGNQIELGGDQERVILPDTQTVTLIQGFDLKADELLYGEHVTGYDISSHVHGCMLQLYQEGLPAGQIILEGISPDSLGEATIRAIRPGERRATLLGRNTIYYISPGDNGEITGYGTHHALQYNTDTHEVPPWSYIEPDSNGNTIVRLKNVFKKEVASFVLPGLHSPESIELYHNTEPVKCAQGQAALPNKVKINWKCTPQPTRFVDLRNSPLGYFTTGESEYGGAGKEHTMIVTGATPCRVQINGGVPSHIHLTDSSQVTLRLRDSCTFTMNTFRVGADQIASEAFAATAYKLGDNQLGLIFANEDGSTSYAVINNFQGSRRHMTCWTGNGAGIIGVEKGRIKDLSAEEQKKLYDLAQQAQENEKKLKKEFPDLGIELETGKRGRGH